MKKRWGILALAALLLGCAGGSIKVENAIPTQKIEGSSLYVKKVEDLPDDFICPWCKHPASDFERVVR